MADKAHRLTDEKLEEMEKRLSAIYSRAEKTVQKKMADYAKSIDEKSAELLQSYKDAETEDEKRKAKKSPDRKKWLSLHHSNCTFCSS